MNSRRLPRKLAAVALAVAMGITLLLPPKTKAYLDGPEMAVAMTLAVAVPILVIGGGITLINRAQQVPKLKSIAAKWRFQMPRNISPGLTELEREFLKVECRRAAIKLRHRYIVANTPNRRSSNPRKRITRLRPPNVQHEFFRKPARHWIARSIIRYGLGKAGKKERVSWDRAKKLIYEKYKEDWSRLGGFPPIVIPVP